MSPSRQAFAAATLAALVVLAGCPPTLTGEKCNSDCACPNGQTCVFEPSLIDTGQPGTCQDGTNHCSGGVPDSGTPDSGSTAFAGQVVLNGGATPPNPVQIYGYANGSPMTMASNGVYLGADLDQSFGDGGGFAFPGPVAPAYDGGYRFAAVYDTMDNGSLDTSATGVLAGLSATSLSPGSDAGLTMRIDVQTSTCYTVTIDAPQIGDQTYLLGVGAVIYDIQTGQSRDKSTDMSVAVALFDAGSTLPSDFIALGALPLQPVGDIPDSPISNSWVWVPDAGVTPVSDEGAFYLTLNDAMNKQPQYPNGGCTVTYSPPPGSPSSLEVNGGTTWGGNMSAGGKDSVLTWQDYPQSQLPNGFMFVGDFITLNNSDGSELYNPHNAVTSPLSIPDSQIPVGDCDLGGCTMRITSVYEDIRKEHSTAYEGGLTLLTFQRIGTTPGG